MNQSDYYIPSSEDIRSSYSRIKNYIHRTPVLSSLAVNKLVNAHVYFKCENFQKAGAFKSRGAVNAVFSLSNEALRNGVATHSSGNHAQALARAASLKNVPAYIVMPETAPKVKINAVKNYGGKIFFCEPNLQAREESLRKVITKYQAVEIHPYNKKEIIQGQATAAMEFLQDYPDLEIIIAPVGGGGLLSGTASTCFQMYKNVCVIGAEPAMADDARRSFYAKKLIPSVYPDTIADGLLTSLGSYTFPIILKHVNDIFTCSEKAIIAAMRFIWERMKIIVEPSAAVGLAIILENKDFFENKRLGIILSGGNLNLSTLPWIK